MGFKADISSIKIKYIPIFLILTLLLYNIIFGRFLIVARIIGHDNLRSLLKDTGICPKAVIREPLMKAIHSCPQPSPGSSLGCIVPPQVPEYLIPTGVTWQDTFCCSYLEEDLSRTNCLVEEDMYNMLDDIIEEEDIVLEVGSRYGTVSCALSEAMGNNGKLITVEADPEVWDIHQYNKLTHTCSSYSVFGVMADKDLVVLNSTQGYARRTSTDGNAEGQKVAHFTWDDIEEQTGLVINTLVIDCEGCLLSLIEMFKHKFKQINKIIVENDENLEEGLLDHLSIFFNGCGEECQSANNFFLSEGFHEKRVVKTGLHYHYVFTKDP